MVVGSPTGEGVAGTYTIVVDPTAAAPPTERVTGELSPSSGSPR
jgi:hypothetical protein